MEIQYGEEDRVYKNAINRILSLNGEIVWFQFTDDGFALMGESGELRHFLYPEAAQYLVDFVLDPQKASRSHGIWIFPRRASCALQISDGVGSTALRRMEKLS